MIFEVDKLYYISESVKHIPYRTPQVEFDYQDRHTILRDRLGGGFRVFHAQGFEAILRSEDLAVFHYLRELYFGDKPVVTERLVVTGLNRAEVSGISAMFYNFVGEETLFGSRYGEVIFGRLLLETIDRSRILIDKGQGRGSLKRR